MSPQSPGDSVSAPSHTVAVNLAERSYQIEIGASLVASLPEQLAHKRRVTNVVLISDVNVASLYGQAVEASLKNAGINALAATIPAGEKSKSLSQAEKLWQQMLTTGADRHTVVVALGGGVVGDLAGFVAATYARGIPLFQVPTTLLAQVDSSVGGKVGINLPGAKNMVGAFWQPLGVLIDIDLLATLPPREYRAGLAEVVKYGMILDAEFFTYLQDNLDKILQRDSIVLAKIVARCCELKADVVRQDEREETGVRSVLNYGHTFCHALESATQYGRFLHGEAVAVGMLCASRLAESLGRIPASITAAQQELLDELGLPTSVPDDLAADRLVELMQRDKKVEHGKLRYVLPSRIGHVELVGNVDPAQAIAAIETTR